MLTNIVNGMHLKLDSIQNDWARRVSGPCMFVLMSVIGIIGCVIELLFKWVKAIAITTGEYYSDSKDDAVGFLQRYIELW